MALPPEERVRVAHVTTAAISLQYLLLNQLQMLTSAGYDVTAVSAPGPETAVLERSGIRHLAVPLTRTMSPWRDLVALWRLATVFRRERFTIVHTHTPKAGLLGQLAARMARVPIVINTVHGFYFHEATPPLQRRLYVLAETVAARCSDAILSQNQEDMATAVAERICAADRISYLGNGIDLSRFNPARIDKTTQSRIRHELGIAADAPVIGFVGRLVKEKGVLDLFAAMRAVLARVPEARLLLIGPVDAEKADCVDATVAQRYGITHACVFTGMRDDMPELYSVMNVCVLPSHREGFPRAPMEASAMGVPCVVTNIRGCRETVEPDKTGLLVPPRDSKALASGILKLLSSGANRRRLGDAARELACRRFDEQRVFARVEREYAACLHSIKPHRQPSTERRRRWVAS